MQVTDKQIELSELTNQENAAYNLNGIGLQVKEIAESMGIAYETAKCYMKSIKEKLGLSKDKEVTAHFWCKLAKIDLDDVKTKVLASVLLLLIVFIPQHTGIRRTERSRFTAGRTLAYRRIDYTTA